LNENHLLPVKISKKYSIDESFGQLIVYENNVICVQEKMKDLEEIVTREVKPNDVIIKAMLHNIKIIDRNIRMNLTF
jgi:hypothetical protein